MRGLPPLGCSAEEEEGEAETDATLLQTPRCWEGRRGPWQLDSPTGDRFSRVSG